VIVATVRCEICGAERREANHWRLARINSGGLHFPLKRRDGDKDVCGQACAHILLDRWLAAGPTLKQASPAPETPE
jgi:hypothetical protein